jgi:predicted negative regulator of RcsB-dependent stress response
VADRTEEEQIEIIKKWWEENGRSTIIGVIAALVIVFGYQGWRNHTREVGEAASAIYEEMLAAVTTDSPLEQVDEDKLSTARFLAEQLKSEHADSTYAHFAAMYLARLDVDKGDLSGAEQELKWAIAHGVDESLLVIVKLRLARVELGLGRPEEALRLLEGVEPGAYRPSYDEVKGDIYRAMGDTEQAREAYQRALNSLEDIESRPTLQMKLDDLVAPGKITPGQAEKPAPDQDEPAPDQDEPAPEQDEAK